MTRTSKQSLAIIGVCIVLAAVLYLTRGCSAVTQSAQSTTPIGNGEYIEVSIADYDNERWGSDRISQELEKKFQVKIVPRPYTQSNRASMVEFWANQNTLPDMFYINGLEDRAAYVRYVKSGAIREIPLAALMSRPNIKSVLANNPIYKELLINGKLYAIPHTFWLTQEEDFKGQVAWCRKDWREALQIPVPTTLDEWAVMLDAFANLDPDGNGIKDTYGISYMEQPVPDFIYLAHGAFVENWVQENGRWIHGACSKQAAKAVAYCRELYGKGIIDPAFVAQKDLKQVLHAFTQGRTGVIAYGSMPDEIEDMYVYFQKSNPGKNPFSCIEVLPFPQGPDGEIRNSAAYNCFSAISFDVNVSDEKLNKILDIIEWCLSEEGERMMLYGFENEDYIMVDNKPINQLGKNSDGTTRTAVDKYPTAMLGYYFNQKSTQRMQGTLTDERYTAISFEINKLYKGKGIEKEVNMKAKNWYSPKKEKINFTKAFYTAANHLILTTADVDVEIELEKFWDEFDHENEIYSIFDELTAYMLTQ